MLRRKMMLLSNNIRRICPLILCIKNFGGIELESIWSKELVFTLNVMSFKHVVKVPRRKTISGTQLKYAAIPLNAACGIIKLNSCF